MAYFQAARFLEGTTSYFIYSLKGGHFSRLDARFPS